MQLMPGESVVASLGNITLTTRRIHFEKSEWGSKQIRTITLDHLTSCNLESHSKPFLLVLTVLAGVLALVVQWSVFWLLTLVLFIAWFFTRRKSIVLRSASDKIEYFGSFGKWSDLQRFLDKVQTAKAHQESIATGRHEEILTAVRTAAATTRDQSTTTQAMPRAFSQVVVPERTPEPGAKPFWAISSSSTLDASARVSSAAPVTAPAKSKEDSGERNASADSCRQDDASDVIISIPTPSDAKPSSARTGDSQPKSSDLKVSSEALEGTPIELPVARPKKRREASVRVIAVYVSVLALLGLSIFLLLRRSERTLDVLTPENRESVTARLQKWSDSFKTGDTAGHMDCYAPVLEIYFKIHQLSREQLSRDKQKAFSVIAVVTRLDMRDIQLASEPNGRITATFQKDWDYSTNLGKGFAGSEIARLTFERFLGEWKIVKEEELTIIRATHPTRDHARLDRVSVKQAGAFRYAHYPDGYLAEELCSESTAVSSPRRYCYPYAWGQWLKDLKQKTAGTKAAALDSDTGTQSPGNLVVWWDSEPRIVFSGCRSHDCPEAGAYFIVAPRTRQMDIIWHNKNEVLYLGPNAPMLQSVNAFALVEQIP